MFSTIFAWQIIQANLSWHQLKSIFLKNSKKLCKTLFNYFVMPGKVAVSHTDLQSFWHSHEKTSDIWHKKERCFSRMLSKPKPKAKQTFIKGTLFLQDSINIQKGFEPIMQGIWLEWLEVSCHVLIKCKQSLRPPKKERCFLTDVEQNILFLWFARSPPLWQQD